MSFKSNSFLAGTVVLSLVFALSTGCASQTRPFTSWAVTKELLNIHSDLCPKVDLDVQNSKIVFFSDAHRGMGTTDEFKNNKELFARTLSHFYDRGYTLVLVGDMEEGWGYQRDNIPLILDDHRAEIEIEKKFFLDNRYYRIFGNHDDYYRGRPLVFDATASTRVYSSVVFVEKGTAERPISIFVTHGCQGHGLHDAGDDVAAWGVSIKYLWLIETGRKNVRAEPKDAKDMEKAQAEYEDHEDLVLDWAFRTPENKPCTLLICGHTHRPVFESRFDPKMVSIVLKDYESGAKKAVSGPFEEDPKVAGQAGAARKEVPTPYERMMIEKLRALKDAPDAPLGAEGKKKDRQPIGPTYFNTGCAFFSEIPCLEISGGHIRMYYITPDAQKNPVFELRGDASLEKYREPAARGPRP